MNSKLELALRVVLNGGAVVSRQVKGMQGEIRQLGKELNSFSAASKAAFAYAGFNVAGFAKNAFDANLSFHRDLLEMKQTGEMSVAQMAQAKKHIMDVSTKMLQTPQDMLEGLRAFTSAGEKYEFALAAVDESARAATAFFARPVEIANMDVDLKQKMGLRADELKAAHNMLLGHARSGRYETKAMSMDAPRTLNTMAQAGMTGIEGVNMMGALTQRLMTLAPTTQASEVATYMEHFLSHLLQPHYVKGLKDAGIDIKKFMPGGKFGGIDAKGNAIGGQKAVDGFLAFLEELNRKGLKDPFKMGEAGFREAYTSKAAITALSDIKGLRDAMQNGQSWAKTDLVGAAFAEIKEADFGKMKAAEVVVEKVKLSEGATKATGGMAGALGGLADFYEEHKASTSAGLAVGGGMLVRLLYKKFTEAKTGGGAGMLENLLGGKAGMQKVFVTNWPASMLSAGEALKQKREKQSEPAGGAVPIGAAAQGAGRLGRMRAGAISGAKWGGIGALAFGAYDAYGVATNDELSAQEKKDQYKRVAGGTAGSIVGGVAGGAIGAFFGGAGAIPGAMIGSTLGGMLGDWLAKPEKSVIDNYAANDHLAEKIVAGIKAQPLNVQIDLDGQQIASAVNAVNTKDSRRH